MGYDGEIKFDTSIDTSHFTSGLDKLGSLAQKGMGLVSKAVDSALSGVKKFGSYAVEVGSNFESGMSQVCATMGITKDTITDDGIKPFELLEKAATEAGATTQFSATEASEALNYLALAGYDAAQAADAMPAVLDLAAAGGLDLAYASDLATDAMGALGIVANKTNLTEFGDKMAKAAQKSNTSVAQLGEAILTVGGTAKELAGGTNELNTALGVLANVGIKGSEGGTALRNIMLAMTPTTDKAANAFERLNLQSYDANGNLRPLNETFRDLNAALSDMNSQEKTETLNAIFNKVDLKSASAMLAACASSTEELGTAFLYAGVPADNLDTFLDNFNNKLYNTMTEEEFVSSVMKDFGVSAEEAGAIYSAFVTQLNGVSFENLYNEIENCGGAMADMAHTMNDNLEGDIKSLNSRLETLGKSVYANIQTPLREVAGKGVEYLTQLNDALNTGGFEGLASEIGTVLSDAVNYIASKLPDAIEIAGSVITSFITGLADASSGIATVIPDLISAVVYTISDNTEAILSAGITIVTELINGISESVPFIAEAAVQLIETLAEGFEENTDLIIQSGIKIIETFAGAVLNNLPSLISAGLRIILAIADAIFNNIDKLIDVALELLLTIVDTLIDNLDELIEAAVKIIMALVNAIAGNIDKLVEASLKIISALTRGIIDNLPILLQAAFQIIAALVAGIISALPDLLKLIKGIPDAIAKEITSTDWKVKGLEIMLGIGKGTREGISGVIKWFDNLFKQMDNWVETSVPLIISGVKEWFSKLPDKIKEELDETIQRITEWGTDVCEKALDYSSKFLENVIEYAKQLPGKINEHLLDVIAKVISWGTQMINEGKNTASEFVSGIITKASELPGKLYDNIKGAIDNVQEWGSNLVQKGRQAAQDLIDTVTGKVSELPGKLAGLGHDIVSGLWNGISNMSGWLSEKISGFGDSVLSSLKDFFGIHSPSRLMRDEIGKNLALGIGVGFEGTMPEITADALSAFDNLVGMVSSLNFEVPSNAYSSGVTNNSSVVNNSNQTTYENNFTIYESGNAQKTARAISEELAILKRADDAGRGN